MGIILGRKLVFAQPLVATAIVEIECNLEVDAAAEQCLTMKR